MKALAWHGKHDLRFDSVPDPKLENSRDEIIKVTACAICGSAFLDSFSFTFRAELKDSGVAVTCLMPVATETEFFERADMLDTKVGTEKKWIRRTSLSKVTRP